MSPRLLCIIIALLLFAVAVGGGYKVLAAHPFLLKPWQRLLRLVAGLLAGFALFALVGAFFYLPAGTAGETASKAEEATAPPAGEAAKEPAAPVHLTWHEAWEPALAAARASGKPLLVDCWATWCKPCKKLYDTILTHPDLAAQMAQFELVKLDTMATANQDFVEKFEVGDDLPWVGFFQPDGTFVKDLRLSGEKASKPFASREAFGQHLHTALARLAPDSAPQTAAADPSERWFTDLKTGFEESRRLDKPLLVDGWAVWCASCIELKNQTFADPEVKKILKGWVKVELDMDLPENEWVWDEYNIRGLPWVVAFAPGEREAPLWQLNGFEPPDRFAQRLESGVVEEESIAGWLASKGLFITLVLVFVAGIAASLTPCAYPMYMLTFGFLTGMGTDKKRGVGAGLLFAALLVLGMAVSYSAAGIFAALGGGAVGRLMQNPWVMGAIALLFIGIGASSLGVLPQMEFSGIKSKVAQHQKANWLWAFIFGLVMGLVVAPCVGPILIAVLTYIAAEGDLALGILLMSTFALGMGVLFFGMALFSQAIGARVTGRFGELITVFFGIVFFAAAFYYLKGVVPFEALFDLCRL